MRTPVTLAHGAESGSGYTERSLRCAESGSECAEVSWMRRKRFWIHREVS